MDRRDRHGHASQRTTERARGHASSARRDRSRSPHSYRNRSRSPRHRNRSRSPLQRNRSRSPRCRNQSRSPSPRSRHGYRDRDDVRSDSRQPHRSGERDRGHDHSRHADRQDPETSRNARPAATVNEPRQHHHHAPSVTTAVDPQHSVAPDAVELDEDAALAHMLGFSSFGSTKGQRVTGNRAVGGAEVKKKRREYRQYLFVKGAYDLPLTKDQLEDQGNDKELRREARQ